MAGVIKSICDIKNLCPRKKEQGEKKMLLGQSAQTCLEIPIVKGLIEIAKI